MDLDIVIIDKDSKEAIISVAEDEATKELYVAVEFRPEINTDNPDMSKDYILMAEAILRLIQGDNEAHIILDGREN